MPQRTSGTPEEAKQRAATTYNAAADVYDVPANSFWERSGSRTVARLQLAPRSNVLDVCCGSGASAIPAAAEYLYFLGKLIYTPSLQSLALTQN